jgi:glycosyltransferase involved in cell wall biosynthesis
VLEPAPAAFRLGAIITAYNEADVIADTIRHLAANGVGVYLIDNWSTDGTMDEALAVKDVEWLGHERYPEDGPSKMFELTRLLERVEAIASNLDVDWIISNDADEFRYSPWPGVGLRDAIFHVDRQGFNAVNHSYLTFELTEDSLEVGSVFKDLTWFQLELFDLSRVTCWHHEPGRIEEIAWSGNHAIRFAGRAVFPYNFLCKHYPIRSLEQGTRKIFRDRLPRYPVSERLKGWHFHYDKLSPQKLIKPTEGLLQLGETFDEDFVIERLTGVGFDPPPVKISPKLRVARVLRRLGVLDRALTLRWRLSGRAAK